MKLNYPSGKPRMALILFWVGVCLPFSLAQLPAQTIFRDASSQVPAEPVITDPSQGPNASTEPQMSFSPILMATETWTPILPTEPIVFLVGQIAC